MATGYCGQRLRKQITVLLPAEEWRALRDEAARQRLPMTELCRRWLRPRLDGLHAQPAESADGAAHRTPARHVESWRTQVLQGMHFS